MNADAVRVLILMGVSFCTALIVTPVVVSLLHRWRLGKQIRHNSAAPIYFELHKKKEGTPTMGGVIIWMTVLGLALIFLALDFFFDGFWAYFNFVDRPQTYLPIAAMLIAGLLGMIDDLLGIVRHGPNGGGLPIRFKFLMYLMIALLGAWWFWKKLGWTVLGVPFVGDFEIGVWYVPLFIFIIVASAFSANETDGLDGLLGGTTLFTFGSLAVVAFVLGRYDLAAFSCVVVGALLASLWFNIYPARFFMGDTGSMALGITMGVIAMLTDTVLLLPLFAPVLVFESLSVIVQMVSKKAFGRKLFLSTPIHHHFEAKGWHESTITMRLWIVSAVGNGLGLVLFFLSRLAQ